MAVLYRPARREELAATQQHIVGSINDLSERHGFGPIASVRPPEFQFFSFDDDPSGFWTAEQDGELVGSAFSWMCGDLWFLAELFIAPGVQGQGVGGELLGRALRQAERAGAGHRALITFAFNRVSQGLYIRHGMFPRLPITVFSAPRETVAARLPDTPLRSVPIADARQRDLLARVDLSALGVSRAKHHAYLATDPAMKGVLLYDGGDCVGYVYVHAGGHVGPLAVTSRDAAGPAFAAGLRRALEGDAPQVSALIPGTNEAALATAVRSGLRIALPLVLMSSGDFGDWRRYMPRNPGFM